MSVTPLYSCGECRRQPVDGEHFVCAINATIDVYDLRQIVAHLAGQDTMATCKSDCTLCRRADEILKEQEARR